MKTQKLSIAASIQDLLRINRSFVFYRKNNGENVTSWVQNNSELYTTELYVEKGFVFAPFHKQQQSILFPFSKSQVSLYKTPSSKNEVGISDSLTDEKEAQSKHIRLVQKAIDFIRKGNVNKVVISRSFNKPFERDQIGILFEALLVAYPTAFVYFWHHPKVGLWMGATPEKLFCLNDDSFATMALAGTQLYSDEIIWTNKEKEEQQWVTDYITDKLLPIVSHLEISKSYTEKAGHLAHIRTDIKGSLTNHISLKDLILRMHPTPAVCGFPRSVAKDFILGNENYNREFYTGFLGEINSNNKSELYVNLRCMQLKNTHATLYVGGGITKDSIAENEWEEIQNKAQVLGKFLS